MVLFKNLGIRFFPTDSSYEPNPVAFEDLPYNAQKRESFDSFYSQPVRGNGFSKLGLLSDSPVSYSINRYGLGTEITNGSFTAQTGTFFGQTFYTLEIDWSTINNSGDLEIRINNGTDYYKSEPVKKSFSKTLIELEFYNTFNNRNLGVFTNNFSYNVFFEGKVTPPKLQINKEVEVTSEGLQIVLMSESVLVSELLTGFAPMYLHRIIANVLESSIKDLKYLFNNYALSERINLSGTDSYEYDTVENCSSGTGKANIVKTFSSTRAIPDTTQTPTNPKQGEHTTEHSNEYK